MFGYKISYLPINLLHLKTFLMNECEELDVDAIKVSHVDGAAHNENENS